VNEVAPFNKTFDDAYRAFEQSGTALLQAISLYLGLDEHYFDEYVHNGNSILRAIHYPPITQEPASAIRAEQHEDINLITLLVGASADGLEILTKQGEWIPVTSLPEQIVVNVGDMLQRFTNNKLRSTTHRVVNPKRELWHTSRFSIPFFLHPRSSMSLRCLDTCIDDAHPKAYEDATAGEYLDERLREIGLKKRKATQTKALTTTEIFAKAQRVITLCAFLLFLAPLRGNFVVYSLDLPVHKNYIALKCMNNL
jgi:isopenicillin N synthase-like dioxygenase